MYEYEVIKPRLFTDEGQRMFLKVRDGVNATLAKAGAIRCQEAMGFAGGGDSWTMLACVDRMVELREIREVPQDRCAGQDRVFIKA
jgi:hypothetical protein